MSFIPLYQPSLSGNEKKYVNECLDSTWISSKGKFLPLFEDAFAKYTRAKFASAVSNGTVALHLALLALGITHDDEVIVPTLTYVASVNAIAYVGATPIFVDSLEDTWQMDYQEVEKKVTPKTKAIMVVHLYGHPCDMDKIIKIAQQHNLHIIEDCAEAFGALYGGKHVGSFGDIATYSFFGNKTITTGEGGMVVTNRKDLFDKVVHYKTQGLKEGAEYWHDVIGYNYRMTNICAAIGLAQLECASDILEKKRQIANWYRDGLMGLPLDLHEETEGIQHSYWMVTIKLHEKDKRDALREYLKKENIETRPVFNPVHKMPMYCGDPDDSPKKYPFAEMLSAAGMNLPSWPDLKESDVARISGAIKDFFVIQ